MFLLFQTAKMYKAFSSYPELILIETIRNEPSSMTLYLFLVINGNGQAEVACSIVLTRESTNNVEDLIQTFKLYNSEYGKIESIFTDKHFKEKPTLHKEFPSAQLCLCVYHSLQNFNADVASMHLNSEQRQRALRMLEKIAYSNSDEEYRANHQRLNELKLPKLISYFNENWHHSRHEWVKGLSKRNRISNIYTTNDLESLNRKVKEVVMKDSSLFDFFQEFVVLLDNIFEESRSSAINMMNMSTVPLNLSPEAERYMEYLTPVAFKFIAAELEKVSFLEGISSYMETTNWSCECSFFVNTNLPCQHMFYRRAQVGEPLFSEALVPEKYSKLYHYNHFNAGNSEANGDEVVNFITIDSTGQTTSCESLDRTEKYNKAMAVCETICNSLAELDSLDFFDKLEKLRNIQQLVSEDKDFTVLPVTSAQVNSTQINESNVSYVNVVFE